MPQDLYQWEEGGGLVHHCPKCQKPLTTPQARTRCLGEHVEWCRRYHTQLFKKGSSSQCFPCRNADEHHERRHREIAELVHKLHLQYANSAPPIHTDLPSSLSISNAPLSTPDDGETTPKQKKKDRKATKKAKKISEMPKVVNAASVEHVRRVLHPNDHADADNEELERRLLSEDPDIQDNRFFHKGTSNVRELRKMFVIKDRKDEKVSFRVDVEEMNGLLQLLNVRPDTADTPREEKKIVDELKQKIEKALVQAQEENDGYMMRKAGFWRWASKKAYNRLVANGRIWEEKGEGSSTLKSEESGASTEGDVVFSTHSGDTTDGTDITEPDTDDGVAEAAGSMAALSVSTPKTPKTSTVAVDDGWTAVNKSKTKGSAKSKAATPKTTIKLSANGGLAKMCQSSTPRRTGFLRFHEDED